MEERKIKRSLRGLSVFFAVFTLLILVIASISSATLDQMFHVAIDDQLEGTVKQYKVNIMRKTEADLQTLYTLASFIEFSRDMDTEQFIQGLYKSNSQTSFSRMGYFPKDGMGIRVTINGGIERDVCFSDLNFQARVAIEKTWTEGINSISDVYYDESLQDYITVYAVPVYEDRTVIGALAVSQSAQVFSKILQETDAISGQGVVAVLDQNAMIMMSTEESLVGTSLYQNHVLEGSVKLNIGNLLYQETGSSIQFQMDGWSYRAFVEPLGINTSRILLIDTEDSISSLLYKSVLISRSAGVLIAVLAVICFIYGYRQIRRSHLRLESLAYYDALTGAYNVQRFHIMLEQIWDETTPCHVVALNIRQFKFINELFGTEKANLLLRKICGVLEQKLGAKEFFCRETADSFFLLLHESDQFVVKIRMEDILTDIMQLNMNSQHQKYPISLYCGVASTGDCERNDNRHEQLMTHVMFALKRAKHDTKDSIVFYNLDLYRREQLQNYVESHMHQALEDGEFQLYLQPKVRLKDNQLGGAEALVRWITTDGNVIYPNQFIPLFEENGFCILLDLYMVEQACKQLRKWIDCGITPVPISINQTKLLFFEGNYVEQLCNITQKYQISPKMITLEILESLAMNSVDELNACIAQLQEKGFRISMDDFGSGYSSLNTLGNLDIDELKLDRDFLMQASKSQGKRHQMILGQIITLAKKMNVSTVAEGVETEQDASLMRELGCDLGQGYYYSRPISASEFEKKYFISDT